MAAGIRLAAAAAASSENGPAAAQAQLQSALGLVGRGRLDQAYR